MLYLVAGPQSIDGDAAVLGLTDLDRGRIAFAPGPGTTQPGQLYDHLLTKVGRMSGPDVVPGSAPDRRWALAGLAATGVRNVFVLHPDTAPAECGRALAAVVEDAGANLWFLLDELSAEWVVGLPAYVRMGWKTFQAEWLAPRLPGDIERRPRPHGPWPRGAPQAVGPDGATVPYVTGFASAADWPSTADDREPMAARIRSLFATYSDPECIGSALAGASGPLYALGWKVVVDQGRLCDGSTERTLETGLANSLGGLRAMREPLAAAATYILARWNVRLSDALDLRIRDVAADASAVFLDDEWRPVPAPDRPVLGGLLAVHRYDQALPNDYFLAAGDFSHSTHALRTMVRVPLAALDLADIEREFTSRPGPNARWLAERGVLLEWMPADERLGGETGFSVQAIRDAVEDVARAFGGGVSPCQCLVRHFAPHPVELPIWPRRPRRARTEFDMGMRKTAG